MHFEYAGDVGNPIISWFRKHLRAIRACYNAGLPEASLVLIYAGIDAFGFLAADSTVVDATGDTFKDWCEKYICTRLQCTEGNPVTSIDLWGARCGFLHTSTPRSKLERKGTVCEIWYQFKGETGVNLTANTKFVPLVLDLHNFAMAFKEGGSAFLSELKKDQQRFQNAHARAQYFLRWGIRK
jgi:hypothetical protein